MTPQPVFGYNTPRFLATLEWARRASQSHHWVDSDSGPSIFMTLVNWRDYRAAFDDQYCLSGLVLAIWGRRARVMGERERERWVQLGGRCGIEGAGDVAVT